MKLLGKTALVTGAAKRIGREIALALAEDGAAIVIHHNQSRKEALALKKEIESLGSKAYLAACDFSPGQSFQKRIKNFVAEVYEKARSIDILVNNASIFYPVPLEKISEKNWDDFLTINLKAPFFLSCEIGKRMLRQKSGKIINLADWTAFRPSPHYLLYGISKAGLVAATTGLAKALAPHIQVNCIAPGPILPPSYGGMTREKKKQVIRKTLLKRLGNPRDIAETVRFLVKGTDFVTGVCIPVDGGSTIA